MTDDAEEIEHEIRSLTGGRFRATLHIFRRGR
jgi:hypothetical protein